MHLFAADTPSMSTCGRHVIIPFWDLFFFVDIPPFWDLNLMVGLFIFMILMVGL